MLRSLPPLLLLLLLGLTGCDADSGTAPAATTTAPAERFAARLDSLSAKSVAYLDRVPVDSLAIPRSATATGELHGGKAREWTSGFYAGLLWQLYAHSEDPELLAAARRWTAFQEGEKLDDHTHDLGFKIYCSFGEGYALTDDPDYRGVIVTAARTLADRFDPTVGAIRSWDWNADVWAFPVIIDNMMNLEMLFAATELTGDSTFYEIAHRHALTTLNNHFRDDNSSFHVVDFDTITGDVRDKVTHQGYADGSAWSRGQAWGLYGFTVAYGYTGDERFLDRARRIAEFMFTHPNLPEDMVPYWDYDAPGIPDEPRDVSAATVAVSGLLDLQQYLPERRTTYLAWADTVLASLATDRYASSLPPFLLDHSVGSVPGEFEVDVPIIYADYYYVEALRRRLALARDNS